MEKVETTSNIFNQLGDILMGVLGFCWVMLKAIGVFCLEVGDAGWKLIDTMAGGNLMAAGAICVILTGVAVAIGLKTKVIQNAYHMCTDLLRKIPFLEATVMRTMQIVTRSKDWVMGIYGKAEEVLHPNKGKK